MKSFLVCLILLTGCKPGMFFITPNEVHKEKVVLFLRNQTTIEGEINISLENYSSLHVDFEPFIQIVPEGKNAEENIKLVDITGYSMGPDYYALKKIDLYMNNVYNLLFVKRLTGENSKIQLYELYESGRGNYSGETKYSYYLSLPSSGPLETMNTRSSSLIPFFDQKMSEMVSDCPTLASKIKSKEKGYFIPLASFNIKTYPEVLLKIINEYNNCN